jgi:prevent-host-death family protein
MTDPEELGVAETKARFSELIDRVQSGERFVVRRRGAPAMALVPAGEAASRPPKPLGLAALAGALAEWETLEQDMDEVVEARQSSFGRPAPDLG